MWHIPVSKQTDCEHRGGMHEQGSDSAFRPECHCPKSAQTCFDQTLCFHAGTEMTQVCNLKSFYQHGRKADINLSWKI